MGKTERQKRDELNEALYNLLSEADVEILDHEYETDEEWGFIECVDKAGRQIIYAFTNCQSGIEMYVEGIHC